MDSRKTNTEIGKIQNHPVTSLKVMRIIWLAMTVSVFVFPCIVYFSKKNHEIPIVTNSFVSFLIMALPPFALGVFVPNLLLKQTIARVGAKSEIAEVEAIQILLSPFITRLAAFEFITVIGFMTVQTSGESAFKMAPYVAATVVGYFQNFPSKERLERWMSKYSKSPIRIKVS